MTERTIKSRIAARTDPRIACRRVFIGVIVAGGPDGDNPRAQDLTVNARTGYNLLPVSPGGRISAVAG
jgi:hypothetical protein